MPPTVSTWETRRGGPEVLAAAWGSGQLPFIKDLLRCAKHLTYVLLCWIPQLGDVMKTPIFTHAETQGWQGKATPPRSHPWHLMDSVFKTQPRLMLAGQAVLPPIRAKDGASEAQRW